MKAAILALFCLTITACAAQLAPEERAALDRACGNSKPSASQETMVPAISRGRTITLSNGTQLPNAHFEITDEQAVIVYHDKTGTHHKDVVWDKLQLSDVMILCAIDIGKYKAVKPVKFDAAGIFFTDQPGYRSSNLNGKIFVGWKTAGESVRRMYGW